MENGIPLNTTFRVTVGELERKGLVRFSPEQGVVAITPQGRRELQAGTKLAPVVSTESGD